MLLMMYLLMRREEGTDWGKEQAKLKDIEPSAMHIHHTHPGPRISVKPAP